MTLVEEGGAGTGEAEGRPLRAQLFGSFRLLAPDGSDIAISGKRSQALLAMLCLAPGVAMEREQLGQLLWRGKFPAHARASLRQILLVLNKQLAPIRDDVLEVTRDRVAVNPAAVQSDLSDLELALRGGPAANASELLLAIGNDPLLAQFDLGEPFTPWLSAQRAQIEQRLRRDVESAIERCQRLGEQREQDRLSEAWRLRCSKPAPGGSDGRTRLAVLPLRCSESDAALAPVALGLFDELITTLAQVPRLLVAGRASSLLAGRQAGQLPQIAQTLRASYLLEGSIQRQDDTVRVHVSLIDGSSGFEIWAHGFEGGIADAFALQSGIARSVMGELCGVLQLQLGRPRTRCITPKREAYELYLQGRALTQRAIGDGVLAKAVELLECALEIEPEFAPGWTALAEAYVSTAVYTPCLDRLAKSARMAECALKAIELEPRQGHARAMLGIHRWTQNDPLGALDLAHEAYRLEPDNPEVALRLGSFLLYIGRTREALPYIEAAVEQDPVNGRNFAMLSVAHLNLGNLEAANAAGRRMVDLGLPSMWLAVATAAAGDHGLAVQQYRQTQRLMNTVIFPPAGTRPLGGRTLSAYWKTAAKGVCSGRAVHRAVYCALLDYLHTTLPDPGDTSIVAPAVWMGYSTMVFKTLGKQITPANMYCLMSLWADVEPIRQTRLHPGFPAFAERIGLVAAWDKYGGPDLDCRGVSSERRKREPERLART